MKYFYAVLLISFCSVSILSAQLEIVTEGITFDPRGLLLVDNTMYIAQEGRISYVDLTEDDPQPQVFHSGITLSIELLLYGNDLYVTAGIPDYRIKKLDFTNPSEPSVNVTNTMGTPFSMLLIGEELYYSDVFGDTLFKINLSETSPTPQVVYSGIDRIRGLALKDNELYITQWKNPGKLYKLDITSPTTTLTELASGLENPIDIEFNGNDLYMSLIDGNKIIRADVTQLPLVFEDVVNVANPSSLLFDDNELYVINGPFENILSKIDVSLLGVDELSVNDMISLYPNPTKEVLHLKGLKQTETYGIYDTSGRLLQKGEVLPNLGIKLTSLASGRYVLKVGATHFNFIKE